MKKIFNYRLLSGLVIISCLLFNLFIPTQDAEARTKLSKPSPKPILEDITIDGELIPGEVLRTIEWEFGKLANVKRIKLGKTKNSKRSYDIGSIGRNLSCEEWRTSQAWQALAGYNSAKDSRLRDIDGIVWCTLRGGGNSATYMKPLIDYLDHAKLSYYTLKAAFQKVFPASDDLDLYYGPGDSISPVVMNLGKEEIIDLSILVKDMDNKIVDKAKYSRIKLKEGRTVKKLKEFKPDFPKEGYYGIEYIAKRNNKEISKSFEFRRFSKDEKFNGMSLFKKEGSKKEKKGEKKKAPKKNSKALKEIAKRVEYLKNYGLYASRFFNDPDLDTKVVSKKEVDDTLKKIKPQPLPDVRRRVLLNDNWRWIGYSDGERKEDKNRIKKWNKFKGTKISKGSMIITEKSITINKDISSQKWRFLMQWKVKLTNKTNEALFSLSQGDRPAVTVGFNNKGRFVYFSGDKEKQSDAFQPDKWYEFKVEVDLSAIGRQYNLYINDKLIAYAVDIQNKESIRHIDNFSIKGIKNEKIDNIWGVGYEPHIDVRLRTFTVKTFIDEDFDISPEIDKWQNVNYKDSNWTAGASLPLAIGSERNKGRDLYMRKVVSVGNFQMALLNLDALDPGGEVYINGKKIARLGREPITLDVSSYLKKKSKNLIAIKVDHIPEDYFIKDGHTGDDLLYGWFSARISLDLTEKNHIKDVYLYTTDINKSAKMKGEITIKNDDNKEFSGKVRIQLYPWFPDEKSKPAAEKMISVNLEKGNEKTIPIDLLIPDPKLWTFRTPNLYKVKATLINKSGKPVDDHVITTGIRTISQSDGTFRINGKAEMLNGATCMQFPAPLTELATWHRCAPNDLIIKQILMGKKLGNTMRIHFPSCHYSDPRYTEYADQLGIMFNWVSTGWNRSEWTEGGNSWGGARKKLNQQVDEYIADMKQVRNHPSIIVWELYNEKVRKEHKSRLFDTFYPRIIKTDPSRLFSPLKRYYRNKPDEPMVINGNQICSLGYGKPWKNQVDWPNKGEQRRLDSEDKGYFAVEFGELAGQDNWNLAHCKPWYRYHSYEWGPRIFDVTGKKGNRTVTIKINEDGYVIPPEND